MKRRGTLLVELATSSLGPCIPTKVSLSAAEEGNQTTPDDLKQEKAHQLIRMSPAGIAETDLPATPGIEVGLSLPDNVEDTAAQVPLYIPPSSDVLASVRGDRPSRIKKTKGQEKIKNILKMTEDNILDEPLFSSDSDVYEPSSSSSDEEYSLKKISNWKPRINQKAKVKKIVGYNIINQVRPLVDKNDDSSVNVENHTVVQAIVHENNNISTDSVGRQPVVEPVVNIPVNNIIFDNVQEQPVVQTIIARVEPQKRKRRKGESINPSDWERNQNVAKRRRGEPYLGLKKQGDNQKYVFNNAKEGRKLGDRCSCTNVRNFSCEKVTEMDRQKLFNNFWKNIDSWEAKRASIRSLVDKSSPVFRRGRTDSEKPRKNVSFKYHLKVGDEKVRVCKKLFSNTFDLGEKSIRSWVLNCPLDQPLLQENNPDNVEPMNEILPNYNNRQSHKDLEKRNGIREFLDSLPKMESHYCRANTTKHYLEPMWESKLQLFREYTCLCQTKNVEPASRALFHTIFEGMNIGFYVPKKDQCETCIQHKLGKVTEEEYQNHQSRKEGARNEKESDKKKAEGSNNTAVFAVDVQKVLTCPDIRASSSYYKTKLKVHNYSIFNLANRDVTCYIWHEGNGQLDGDIFASMVVRFLNKELEKNPDITEIIIWSDGCTNQNRCETVSNALLYFAINKNVTVYQKYLEVGHTQMEVDSVHSTIEKKIKKHEHYVPADYIRDIREARMQPSPYFVESLTYKDFSCYANGYYKSIRPGYKKGDPYVTDLRCLKYAPDGHIWFKLNFSESWTELPRRPKSIADVYTEIKPLYKKPVPIKMRKFKDLQDLKKLLEEDYQSLYDNLSHESCEGECSHIL